MNKCAHCGGNILADGQCLQCGRPAGVSPVAMPVAERPSAATRRHRATKHDSGNPARFRGNGPEVTIEPSDTKTWVQR